MRKASVFNAFGILPKHYDYTTGIDYSYIDAKYFKNIKDMAVIIKNSPKENGKWLIFVTKKIDGITIKEIIGNLKTGVNHVFASKVSNVPSLPEK